MCPIEIPTLNESVATESATPSVTDTPDKTATATPPGGDKPVVADPAVSEEKVVGQVEETKGKEVEGDTKKEEEDLARFDKHPRFQELIKTKDDLTTKTTQLEAQNALLSNQMKDLQSKQTQLPPGQELPPAENFDAKLGEIAKKLDDGDMSMSEYMTEYTKVIQAQTSQQVQAVASEQEKSIKMSSLEQDFLTKHPDYLEVVNSGKLEAIKQANPLHDNISAYYAYDAQQAREDGDKRVEEAVEKAKKETEETMVKNFKAKGRAGVLGEGPTHAPPEQGKSDARLSDPNKHGGETNLLAARLAERRAQKNAG